MGKTPCGPNIYFAPTHLIEGHIVKPLGVAIIISTVLGVRLMALSETVHLYKLIHWPSAVLVLGITLGVLMIWQPSARWRRVLAFTPVRSKAASHPTNAHRQQALASFFTAASRAALIAGLAGELLGIFMILSAAKNPAAIEPGITIATVSLLYGFGLSELVFQQLRKRAAPDAATAATTTEQAVGRVRPQHVGSTHHALRDAKVSS